MLTPRPAEWFRAVEIILGLVSIAVCLIVLLNPGFDFGTILGLLAFATLVNGFRMFAGGFRAGLTPALRGSGLAGGGVLIIVAVVVVFYGLLGPVSPLLLLASGIVVQGAERLFHVFHASHPRWLRSSAFVVAGLMLLMAGATVAFPDAAKITLVGLLTLSLLVYGLDSIVSGIRPSSPKQLTLLKLIFFAIFYGFVNINWIDLFATQAPAYHVWLILTYMAPFGVLIVFQGWKDWQLALSLGLLVSLVNDLGYYFSGDLFFGFHVKLIPWLEGQLGLLGNTLLFNFQGGLFTIPVTSAVMGVSVYARVAAVGIVLYHWWTRPERLPG